MTVKAHLIFFLWCLCITQLNKTIKLVFFLVFYRKSVFEQAVWRQTG